MVQTVVPGYFEVVGLRLRRGRTFEAGDNTPALPAVAIVNEAFARKFWPAYPSRRSPLGERLTVPISAAQARSRIVGVVADVHQGGPLVRPIPQVYIPDRLYPPQTAFLALRANGDPLRAVDAVRAQVRAIDANQSITDVRTMDGICSNARSASSTWRRGCSGCLPRRRSCSRFIGLYGVMGLFRGGNGPRRSGFDARSAPGIGEVLWMVVGQGLRVTLIGHRVRPGRRVCEHATPRNRCCSR